MFNTNIIFVNVVFVIGKFATPHDIFSGIFVSLLIGVHIFNYYSLEGFPTFFVISHAVNLQKLFTLIAVMKTDIKNIMSNISEHLKVSE